VGPFASGAKGSIWSREAKMNPFARRPFHNKGKCLHGPLKPPVKEDHRTGSDCPDDGGRYLLWSSLYHVPSAHVPEDRGKSPVSWRWRIRELLSHLPPGGLKNLGRIPVIALNCLAAVMPAL
jgi:hypothetical protein